MQQEVVTVDQHVLEALAARLQGATIKRSVVEEVICERSGGADLRRSIDHVLRRSQIRVIDDAVI